MRRTVIKIPAGSEIKNERTHRVSITEFDHIFLAVPNGPEQYRFSLGSGSFTVPSDVVTPREVEVETIDVTMMIDDRGRVLQVRTASTFAQPRESNDGDIFWPVAEVGSHSIGIAVREKD